ncbi:protein PXR1 [Calycina marina]|uniref:Protein PXR1 n=1 Tax=Calycina marina TaxID=1763456 RepID=A0A9P8CHP0_9HELO|nr:protein PXR1 [Calycina marina]
MGLAAPKNRIKLSQDPNNTRWHGNKEGFGHKIMSSQGWKEGQYLGAVDASHSEHYTAANASHIRVTIKDDNLGLGAKIGSGVGAGECTGLDAFKNILGRLNGKDEDAVEQEQRSRDELRRAIYTERKWGSTRFVRGGFLIGDKIQDLIDGEAERIKELDLSELSTSSDSSSSESDSEPTPAEISKKKRKHDSADDEVTAEKKKSKKRKTESKKAVAEVVAVKVKKSKKDKKENKLRAEPEQGNEETTVEDKAAAKLQRRKRKEDKKAKKVNKSKKRSSKDKLKSSLGDVEETSASESKPCTSSTPVTDSGRPTPMIQGRHAVRARNIAQKRLASMDVAALNQIFMIKTSS